MKTLKDALKVMKNHTELDLLVQGKWLGDEGQGDQLLKGCFFGCAMQTEDDPIEKFCKLYGMPLWIGYLSESIFEGISEREAVRWQVALLELMVALPADFNYEEARHNLAILRLTKLFNENKGDAKAAIKGVIDCHKNPNDADFNSAGSAAWSATWSAGSAVWSAAESAGSAAESVAWSARSAAESAAGSAWSAAGSAAWSAAWSLERDNLLSVFRESSK
jgi:hypothetical protein